MHENKWNKRGAVKTTIDLYDTVIHCLNPFGLMFPVLLVELIEIGRQI